MTLFTTDYLEFYLTLVAWIVNNGIWNVLVASGMVALPFIAIVVQEWLRARAEGADEGNKGILSSARIENRVWVAIVIIMFAGIPFIPVNLNTIQYDRSRTIQCQVTAALPSETQWQPAFTTLNDQTALVPIWWFFVHAVSKAVTAAAVASIPAERIYVRCEWTLTPRASTTRFCRKRSQISAVIATAWLGQEFS